MRLVSAERFGLCAFFDVSFFSRATETRAVHHGIIFVHSFMLRFVHNNNNNKNICDRVYGDGERWQNRVDGNLL